MLAFSSVMQQNKMHCSERVNSIFTRSTSQWVEIVFKTEFIYVKRALKLEAKISLKHSR
jgi:hypothetical protein